jgi:predicted small secreted protein
MNSNMKRFVRIAVGTALLALCSTACNTSKGFGKDVEKLGDKIQEKAR